MLARTIDNEYRREGICYIDLLSDALGINIGEWPWEVRTDEQIYEEVYL